MRAPHVPLTPFVVAGAHSYSCKGQPVALLQTSPIASPIMTTSQGDAPANRDSGTWNRCPFLQPLIVIVTSLDSYLLLLREIEALHGCMSCLWLPGEQSKDKSPAFLIPSHSLTQHCLSGKRAWESFHCLVESTAEGQNCLFASQDAHKLPSVVLAAS